MMICYEVNQESTAASYCSNLVIQVKDVDLTLEFGWREPNEAVRSG
jgi:hypothetical protein